MELNEKNKQFAKEYVKDFNGTQAAIRAGYSKKTAKVTAAKLLTKANIQSFIKKLQERTAERVEITKERLLNELYKIAISDVRKIYTVDGCLDQANMLDDDIAPAIAGVETKDIVMENITIGRTTKLKMWDKISAIQTINKMLGFNAPEKTELSNPDGTLRPATPFSDNQVDKIITALRTKKK